MLLSCRPSFVIQTFQYTVDTNLPGRLVVVAEGQLGGPWPLRPFIDWLYQLTGQRDLPLDQPLDMLAAHNFEARWKMVEHEGIMARLLIADKSRAD